MRTCNLHRDLVEGHDFRRLPLFVVACAQSGRSHRTRSRTTAHKPGLLLGLIKPIVFGILLITTACSGGGMEHTTADYLLTVMISGGSGSDSVSSSPDGISCPSTCSASYSSGTAVTLTETPAGNDTFTGWSGGGCSGTSPTCTLTMTAAASITAKFSSSSGTSSLSLVQSAFSGNASGCNETLTCTLSASQSGDSPLSQPIGANHLLILIINGEGTNNFPVAGTPSCNFSGCGTWVHLSGENVVSASGTSTTSGNYCHVEDLNSTGHHFMSDCWAVYQTTGGSTSISVTVTDPGGGADIPNMDLFLSEWSCSTPCAPSLDTQKALVYPGNGASAGCTSCNGPLLTLSGTNDLVMQDFVFEENCNTGCAVTNYTLQSWDTSSQNATAYGLDLSSAPIAVWPQTPKGGGISIAFAITY
jgi:hypothetical protein